MSRSDLMSAVGMLAVAVVMAPVSAHAAEPMPREEEELIVTAQRREQNLQEVPLAVSLIGAQDLTRQEVLSTNSLLRLFPNVSGAQVTGSGANNIAIRGLSNAETAATFDAPVATYIDGIYMGRINSNNFALFDTERVEVLRGPQGTLFGRNTTGGAVNIVLRKPSRDFEGNVEAEYGSYDHYQLRGSLNLPVSDSVRTRFAAYVTDEDGWVRNLTTGGTNNARTGWGARGAVSIDLSPSIVWDLAADFVDSEGEFIPATKVNGKWVSRSGLTKLGSLVTGKKGQIPGNYVDNETWGVTSNFSIETGLGDVSVITGYRDLTHWFNADYFDNPSPIGGYVGVQYSTHKQFSQEANISGKAFDGFMNYTVGLYYFHEDNMTDFSTVFRLGSGAAFIESDRTLYNDTNSYAAYAQVELNLTERLTATLGARYTIEKKKIHYRNNGNPLAVYPITDDILLADGVPLDQDVDMLTPRVALQYEASDDVMVFASATRGFKSGGWNVRASRSDLLRDFDPEKTWSYEAGVRSKLLDGRAIVNLTGFYADTSDLQIATAIATAWSAAPQFPVGNFSDFRSWGGELEMNFYPTDGLSIFANAGYNKTKYHNPRAEVIAQQAACIASIAAGEVSRPNCGQGIIRPDGAIATPLRAPEFTGTIGFSWEIPVSERWQIVPSANGRYTSKFNVNAAELPTTWDNGYFQLAGSLGLEEIDGGLRLSIGCENCTDSTYLVAVIGGQNFWSAPRRWMGRISYSF